MSSIGKAVGKVVGGITGSNAAAESAEDAGRLQAGQSQLAIDEQRRQFDKIVELMSPFVTAGTGAVGQQQALLGLQGAQAQQAAINQLQQMPYFQGLVQQGENALLQNAAATGGLRGGNTQAALAQFRPQMLNNLIQQQFGNLGGLSQLGQASAANQASAGMSSAANIGNLLGQKGAALAGAELAGGSKQYQAFGDLAQLVGGFTGAGGISGLKKLF